MHRKRKALQGFQRIDRVGHASRRTVLELLSFRPVHGPEFHEIARRWPWVKENFT
jgi:hypothetical protein